eukprot:scaffold3499_cov117-Isochrysis_galbana.AAC.5
MSRPGPLNRCMAAPRRRAPLPSRGSEISGVQRCCPPPFLASPRHAQHQGRRQSQEMRLSELALAEDDWLKCYSLLQMSWIRAEIEYRAQAKLALWAYEAQKARAQTPAALTMP